MEIEANLSHQSILITKLFGPKEFLKSQALQTHPSLKKEQLNRDGSSSLDQYVQHDQLFVLLKLLKSIRHQI